MRQKKPLSRRSDLVTQEIGNELLIYDLNENKAFNLNQTSAMIWQLCDGNRTISDIAHNMSGKLDTNITEDFVRLALDQFSKDNLLENSPEFDFSVEDISRRDVIRKIGFSTLVALPIVSSLIAPAAVNAQSLNCTGTTGRSLGCACTAISQCQPPTNRCCSSVPGNPRTCVPSGLQASGQPCGVNCDCASGTCLTGAPRVCA